VFDDQIRKPRKPNRAIKPEEMIGTTYTADAGAPQEVFLKSLKFMAIPKER